MVSSIPIEYKSFLKTFILPKDATQTGTNTSE